MSRPTNTSSFADPEAHRADRVAHAELGDHPACDLGRAVDVVVGAGGRITELELFRGATAEEHRHLVLEFAPRTQQAVLGRQDERVPERATHAG